MRLLSTSAGHDLAKKSLKNETTPCFSPLAYISCQLLCIFFCQIQNTAFCFRLITISPVLKFINQSIFLPGTAFTHCLFANFCYNHKKHLLLSVFLFYTTIISKKQTLSLFLIPIITALKEEAKWIKPHKPAP